MKVELLENEWLYVITCLEQRPMFEVKALVKKISDQLIAEKTSDDQ